MNFCDFCSCIPKMPSEWKYDCKDFLDEHSATNMVAEWYACGACSQFIEEEDLRGLVDRAVSTYMQTHPIERRVESQVRNHVYQLYIKFWNHRKGGRSSA